MTCTGLIRKIRRRALLALSAGAALSSCAGIPDVGGVIAGDRDGRLARAVLGPGSPLTPTERHAAVERLAQQNPADLLQLHYALTAALAESPLVPGNQVTLLSDGRQAFPAMFDAMQAARNHINLEFFILDDVSWDGVTLSQILLRKLRQGVVVNMIYDAYGSQHVPEEFRAALRDAGANIITFNPLDPLEAHTGWSPNDRDHRKILVVDGRVGFIGGINLDKAYENPPSAGIPADGDTSHAYWRDNSLRLHGPIVAELQKLFFGTWRDQKGPAVSPALYYPPLPRTGAQTVRIIGSSPGEQRPLYYVSLLTALRAARSRVWLSSGYFVPPHQEREDMARAARHGIDLRLVVPSWSDVPAAVYAARAAYGDLLEAGAHIFEVRDAVLHAKLAAVDGVWSVVGSSNLDRRSVVFNNEADAIVLGHDTASQVEAVMQADMARAHAITLANWRRRSVGERFDELEARLWQYWF